MTEVRVSLSQIHLQDLGDGRIEVNLVPGFARKVGHHISHHLLEESYTHVHSFTDILPTITMP